MNAVTASPQAHEGHQVHKEFLDQHVFFVAFVVFVITA
jgi:hypothetical protein